MELQLSDGEIFISKINDNDKDQKPIRFSLKYLTIEDQMDLDYYEYSGNKDEMTTKIYTYKKYVEIFNRGVKEVFDFSVNGKPIKTAKEFLAIAGGPEWIKLMVVEVALRLKQVSEIDVKN